MTYYAHSSSCKDKHDWQPLVHHLTTVGRLASQFAEVFNANDLALAAGILHDLGKYTPAFQRRLAGGPRVDHATRGAQVAAQRWPLLGQLLAYGIAGHHAGLANGIGGHARSSLADRLSDAYLGAIPSLDPIWQQEITLPTQLGMPSGFKMRPSGQWFQLAFLARMVFSCLADADFIDTDNFYRGLEGTSPRSVHDWPPLTELRAALNTHLTTLQQNARGSLNATRADILREVRAGAAQDPGLFSLTVPTGGGKTLASLAFALDHAIAHGLDRVIYVIPYTSIIEQNTQVFRNALGAFGERVVLEHHSAFVDKPRDDDKTDPGSKAKLRLASENWDAPVIVTTAVQFFESLFADRPSRCRKLHHIANSVVILDEAQTLPNQLLRACVAAIDELAANYRTSIVLCTATQPVLEKAKGFPDGLENVRELIAQPKALYRKLKRVTARHVGGLDDAAILANLQQHPQALCIVNSRKHARALFQTLSDQGDAFHLTTYMHAHHRSHVLDEVRRRLKQGLPCRLVSTSLIEAGVDVDFPYVMRAEAGLDSIAQAAGRCNREGRQRADTAEVHIFLPAEKDEAGKPRWRAPTELALYAQTFRTVQRSIKGDLLGPEAMQAYFSELQRAFGKDGLDGKHVTALYNPDELESVMQLAFETTAQNFHMIEQTSRPIIVPWSPEEGWDEPDARRLLNALPFAERVGSIARQLQPWIVQAPDRLYRQLLTAHTVEAIAADRFGDQFVQLTAAGFYDADFGLHWDDSSVFDPAGTIA